MGGLRAVCMLAFCLPSRARSGSSGTVRLFDLCALSTRCDAASAAIGARGAKTLCPASARSGVVFGLFRVFLESEGVSELSDSDRLVSERPGPSRGGRSGLGSRLGMFWISASTICALANIFRGLVSCVGQDTSAILHCLTGFVCKMGL